MTDGATPPRAPARGGVFARACDAIDAIDDVVGRWLGPVVIAVTIAIVYEVVARTVFTSATVWANEATVYGSAAVYLLAGGYAMRHGRHVKLDGFVESMPAGVRRALPLVRLPFMLAYALTLVFVGGGAAWTSFLQGEATGTPWNPPIWPVKACIPIAGLLLCLQMLADTARELGWVGPRSAP